MEDSDFAKMTVAELKKALKTRGLPVAGNKTELIARLQGAVATDGAADDAAEEEDFDEDEILAGDGAEGTDVKITPQEEAAALKGSVKIKKTTELQGAQEKKKISLKRSEPLLEPEKEASAVEPAPEVPEEPNKENVETTEPAKKVIKLNEAKSDVYESRAQRFGIPMTEAARKEARAARFGASATNAKPAKLSMETGGIDVDKLKSRAERFGEVTAKTLTKEKQADVMKKRKEKFESSEIKADIKTVKTVSKVNDETTAAVQAPKLVGAASDEEAKKLRAERFGV